ncbi:MAG: desulfoferrodoxin [bacterium]
MTKINEIYKCEICGNIVEMTHGGNGTLTCCGESMKKIEPQSGPEGQEKHLPVSERDGNKIIVTVGSVLHPMLEEHYIEWIEIISRSHGQRVFLNPGDEPKAEFLVDEADEEITIRAYCNVHGLWSIKL